MSNRTPVFDDWGRKVGDFIPEGGGWESVLVSLIAILILWTIGFVLYAIYRLISNVWQTKRGKRTIFVIILMSLVVAGCLLLLIVNDNIRAEKQQQSAVDQQTNNLKILRVIKESPAGPTFHNWDISIEILNPGPYEMLVVDISGSQTDEPWSSECSAISAWSGTLLFGIPQPDSEESTWYACKIKEAYKASLWKRSWGIQVSMFEHSIRESPVGSSWRKIR